MCCELICRERLGNDPPSHNLVWDTDSDSLFKINTIGHDDNSKIDNSVDNPFHPFTRRVKRWFYKTFLPQGYPQSVSSDYARYQMFDTIQAFASSVLGSISTQAILKGVGVGDQSATPLSATLNWILKSGVGMVGQIVFSYHKSTELDRDCKRWRLFADLINDVAMFVEIVGSDVSSYLSSIFVGVFAMLLLNDENGRYFHHSFFIFGNDSDGDISLRTYLYQFFLLVTYSMSSILRCLVGVIGSATRMSITQHQALGSSSQICDISAKDASQEVMVNLIALIFNLIFLPILNHIDSLLLTWFVVASLISVHLWANFKAVRSLHLTSLNEERLVLILKSLRPMVKDEIKKTKWQIPNENNKLKTQPSNDVLFGSNFSDDISVENINERESVSIGLLNCQQNKYCPFQDIFMGNGEGQGYRTRLSFKMGSSLNKCVEDVVMCSGNEKKRIVKYDFIKSILRRIQLKSYAVVMCTSCDDQIVCHVLFKSCPQQSVILEAFIDAFVHGLMWEEGVGNVNNVDGVDAMCDYWTLQILKKLSSLGWRIDDSNLISSDTFNQIILV